MSIKKQIFNDLKNCIKNRNSDINDLKLIVGEIQRLPNKDPNDEEIIKLLTKLSKNENEIMKIKNIKESNYLNIINNYLPKLDKLSEDEIINWIKENIDFNNFKNKMESIKIIINNFGNKVDGKIISKIIREKF